MSICLFQRLEESIQLSESENAHENLKDIGIVCKDPRLFKELFQDRQWWLNLRKRRRKRTNKTWQRSEHITATGR